MLHESSGSQGSLGAIQETESDLFAATGQKMKTPKSNNNNKGTGESGKQACYFCGHPCPDLFVQHEMLNVWPARRKGIGAMCVALRMQ